MWRRYTNRLKGGGRRFGIGGGAKPHGVWGRESPSGSRGGAPVGSMGDEIPGPEAEEF